eukprot:CAMPEP_0182427154 /NCGR_PEP_ID=MMETSP1167-20130531/14975_1 /TAXON_ID=2988 /ORGANISM="Mallomonas Sp, Strain CCMP3275" /LENGTH=241 /DNA_ID=CAMNT_0024609149 /DNA_START=176 /DNA_END=901 /DNA_ORIENTATION=+
MSLVFTASELAKMTVPERLSLYEKWQETRCGQGQVMFKLFKSRLWRAGFGVKVTGHYGPAQVGTLIPFKAEVWTRAEYEAEAKKRKPPRLPDGMDAIMLHNSNKWVYVTCNYTDTTGKLLGNWVNSPLRLSNKNIEDGWDYVKQLRTPLSNKPVPSDVINWYRDANMEFGVHIKGKNDKNRKNHQLYGRITKTVAAGKELLICYGAQYKMNLGVFVNECEKYIREYNLVRGIRRHEYNFSR